MRPMADPRDFYEVLGVPRGASQEDVQRAYRQLARQHHPDVNKDPGAEDRFKEIAEAYDVLSDPDTRRRYDAFGHRFRQVPEGVDPDTWAAGRGTGRRPSGAGGGRQRVWTSGFGSDTGEGFDAEDLFEDLFGRRGWGTVAGADQEVELELTVEEAYRGGRRSLTLTGPDGPRRYDVTIPAGVRDGQRIRLSGQGGQGTGGAASGDLYLVVRIAPHPRYRLEGPNIVVELRVAPWEAALGTTVPVDTPGGEAKLRVPPGTSSGRRLRLSGRGMPARRGKPGDLLAELRIMVPATLTDDERRLFEELAGTSTFDPRSGR